MREYVIVTDSSCDLSAAMAAELEVEAIPLTVILDGTTYKNYLDGREIGFSDFYAALRQGKRGSTSAVNVDEFRESFLPYLEQGKDLLYLGFSTGLSATFQAAEIAATELRESYPEQKIITVDTLCASLGQGLMVYEVAKKKRAGATLEEAEAYARGLIPHMGHWVAVDDLAHLKRGGRISAAAALLGGTLNIKPIIHVDDEGKLVNVEKVRGRKNSIRRLFEQMCALGTNLDGQAIFISHADCLEEAEMLADMIREAHAVERVEINYIGPVIGSHTGPGTIALFFQGKHR